MYSLKVCQSHLKKFPTCMANSALPFTIPSPHLKYRKKRHFETDFFFKGHLDSTDRRKLVQGMPYVKIQNQMSAALANNCGT